MHFTILLWLTPDDLTHHWDKPWALKGYDHEGFLVGKRMTTSTLLILKYVAKTPTKNCVHFFLSELAFLMLFFSLLIFVS